MSTPRHEIFVSYAHEDVAWRQRLFGDHVSTGFGDCLIWSDVQIRVGDAWRAEIDRRLESSTVAVLLASPHFLASEFITECEYPRIMARADQGTLRVVWIPIGLTAEKLLTERPALAEIQAATSLDDALPADPQACSAEQLQRLRQHIRARLQQAVDAVGAELADALAHRYDLGLRIGSGNRAAVYRARDRVLSRDVAVKVLTDRAPDSRALFIADVRRAVTLSEQPNFINLYDCCPPEGLPYCVQQLVAGKTLRQRLDELPAGQPLPVQRLRRIFERLARAVARAHAARITYGNLKPANIILDAEDEPFILPVGRCHDEAVDNGPMAALLARLAECRASGTPIHPADADDLAYLVPDQFGQDVQAADPFKVDQYMLGLLAWEMATGHRPQAVAEPHRLLEQGRAAFADLPKVGQLRPLCPERIEALIHGMTRRLARDRFHDLKAVLDAVEALPDVALLIVQDSWRRVTATDAVESRFFHRFYDEFLRRNESASRHFAHFGPDRWLDQHRMLKDAVLLLLAFYQQGDSRSEPNVLSRLVGKHHGISAQLYEPFGDALVDTLCGNDEQGLPPADPLCRQPRQRDALQEHWRHVVRPGLAYLSARAQG